MGFKYSKRGNKASLTSYLGNDEIVVVPSTIDGLEVNKVCSMCFFGDGYIKEIRFPDNISIENNAIVDCESLERVYLGKTGRLGNFLEDCPKAQVYTANNQTSNKVNRKNLIEKESFFDLSIFETSENKDGTICIIGVDKKKCKDTKTLAIPNYIDGKKVTKLGLGAFSSTNFIEVILNSFIEEIPGYCFSYCYLLEGVRNLNNIKTIGSCAFYTCRRIESIEPMPHLGAIGEAAFKSTHLKSFPFSKKIISIGKEAFAETYLEEVDLRKCSDKLLLNWGCFRCCPDLKTFWFSRKMTEIVDNCLDGCRNLTKVYNLTNITKFGSSCFCGCRNLTLSLDLSKASFIGARAFRAVHFSRSIKIDNCTLCEEAFEGISVQNLTITSNYPNTIMPIRCFYEARIGKVTFDEKIKVLKDYCFSRATIGEVIVNSIEKLKSYVFYSTVIKKDLIFEKLESIGSFALTDLDCPSINMEKSPMKELTAGAFKFYRSKEIILPSTLEEIGDEALAKCRGLKNLIIPPTVRKIGRNAFDSLKITNLEIPASVREVGEFAFCSTEIKNLVINHPFQFARYLFSCATITKVDMRDFNMPYVPQGTFNNATIKQLILPSGIKEIRGYAFGSASIANLEVDFSDVEVVKYRAFYCSNIKNFKIPTNVVCLEEDAFLDCLTSSKELEFPNLTEVGDAALTLIEGVQEMSFGSELSSIGKRNFEDCRALKKIRFKSGKNVTKVKNRIYFKGRHEYIEIEKIK